ncbi:sensory protein [Acidihalobacter yilgarnensis]|uniref:Sensory protein n=1 Tax=Acidihalobacter yilgarnensis TaxID=2819280 RepID=A0A1D8IKG5_9GAMM|nr:TspO/MBR family protein [Acidihalobacter yilgarnensis]AOU96956.1 sensory protein [Acidihalobacter yilgarnensis]
MRPRSYTRQLLGLVGWFLFVYATATIGAVASIQAVSFYLQLTRPAWAPPAWAFGPVWTALYALMAMAAWLVWRSPGRSRGALTLFVIQLAANALWSWLFFVWHIGAYAFIEVLLVVLIVATLAEFWRVSRLAAALLLPYLAWVLFAAMLTWSVWRNNPGFLG